MYTIYCDDYLLHSEVKNYSLISAKLTMEVNTAGSLTFTILPNHPNYSTIQKLKSEIIVVKNNKTYWKGRIPADTQNFDTSGEIYCEGKLKTLADSQIRPGTYSGSAVTVFQALINSHNSQVQDFQNIKAGNVWNAGTITRVYTDYNSTYTNILELVSSLGGYLRMRYESDGDYLDWVEDFTVLATQGINLGENILSLSKETSWEDVYTRCIPLGAETNGVRLNITSIKTVDYLDNSELMPIFGTRCAPVSDTTWDDVTDVNELVAKGQAYLNSHAGGVLTLTITALDLSYTDATIESFDFCDYIDVSSAVHNLLGQYLLSKLEINITNPANDKITLGQTVSGITDTAAYTQNAIVSAVRNIHTIISQTTTNSFGPADVATQTEAEAGAADDKVMTPLKTKYAITALGPGAFSYSSTIAAATADKGSQSGNIMLGQIIELTLTNGNTSASPTITIGGVTYTISGLPIIPKINASNVYRLKKTDVTTLTFLATPRYVIESGTTSSWIYTRYSDNKIEAYQISTLSGTFTSGTYYSYFNFDCPTAPALTGITWDGYYRGTELTASTYGWLVHRVAAATQFRYYTPQATAAAGTCTMETWIKGTW